MSFNEWGGDVAFSPPFFEGKHEKAPSGVIFDQPPGEISQKCPILASKFPCQTFETPKTRGRRLAEKPRSRLCTPASCTIFCRAFHHSPSPVTPCSNSLQAVHHSFPHGSHKHRAIRSERGRSRREATRRMPRRGHLRECLGHENNNYLPSLDTASPFSLLQRCTAGDTA